MREMIKEFLLLDSEYKFKWQDVFAVLGGIAFMYGTMWVMVLFDVAIHGI